MPSPSLLNTILHQKRLGQEMTTSRAEAGKLQDKPVTYCFVPKSKQGMIRPCRKNVGGSSKGLLLTKSEAI